jgi:hypothetical protein
MEELAGEGAAVILAGFDRASADRASAWSEASGVPVLLLAAPSAPFLPKKAGFVIGERTERQLAMLADALTRRGVRTSAFISDTAEDDGAGRAAEGRGGLALLPPIRCDVALQEAGRPRFPIDSWLKSGAAGWLVSGPSSCARDVLRDIRRVLGSGRRLASGEHAMALTLEASVPLSEVPPGIVVLSASAGLVPVLAARPEDAKDEDVRAFMDRFGVRPSYWTAIGRDGGALARAALAPLPADATDDTKAVTQRRAIVQAGLLSVRVRLWTTDDRGIGEGRVLPRALRLTTWGATKPQPSPP